MAYDIEKAIELGKIWMKNSTDAAHDFDHCNAVELNALEIYNELKPQGITQDMVKLACWWHDCYKARCKQTTWYSIYHEGEESKAIFEREIGKLVAEDYVEKIGKAILNHNRAFYILFNHKKLDDLSMILIEADQIDGLNPVRNLKNWKQIKSPIIRTVEILLSMLVPLFLMIIRRSNYTERILKLRRKKV